MRNHFLSLILAMAAQLAISHILLAQTPEPAGASKSTPDLSGVWDVGRGAPGRGRLTLEDPPLQPWAMEIYQRNKMGSAGGDVRADELDRKRDDLDPNLFCFPRGPTRAMVSYPFEIIHAANKVVIILEVTNGLRQIWTDGRGHPEAWPFGWMGHSIGRWNGDTLVVDTVALNDRTWIDRGGAPHSDALHVVERMRRVRQDALEVEFTLEDPKAFTRPWTIKRAYELQPNGQILEYIDCEEILEIGGKYRPLWQGESKQQPE